MDMMLAMQASGMGQPKPKKAESPDLPQTVKQDDMIKLITDYPEVKKLLLEHLPEGQ